MKLFEALHEISEARDHATVLRIIQRVIEDPEVTIPEAMRLTANGDGDKQRPGGMERVSSLVRRRYNEQPPNDD